VIDVLESLGVAHFVGGSLASSAHGVPRASIDADVIADLAPEHVAELVSRLQSRYYLDETRVRDAVASRRSFNLIHLDTMFKIDVFTSKGRPFDVEALRRARPQPLEDTADPRAFRVATPEDTILAKLEWFRSGGETSERQWADIMGIIRTGGSAIDIAYLRRWAPRVGVDDLLDRVLREAGAE
jgi:hypothetical protein